MATDVDVFSKLGNDVLIKIIFSLHLKDWGSLACVSKKLYSIQHDFCYKMKCTEKHPKLVSDLLSDGVLTSPPGGWVALFKILFCCPGLVGVGLRVHTISPEHGSHFSWWEADLSREQGKLLLHDEFSSDCLYMSKWFGCKHIHDEKYYYLLFRGIFLNFKKTKVWKILDDGYKYSIGLNCAFCDSYRIWDLYSSSCLIRVFGIHDDDGEQVYRGFVCENGHVFGAWRDPPGGSLNRKPAAGPEWLI